MSKTARRARIAATIELLCDRFPQTFSRNGRQPLKVGVYADVLAALGDGIQPRDLQSALRYTSTARYLRAPCQRELGASILMATRQAL